MSIGKTVVTSSVGSVSDSLIVESDVQADPSSPASVHWDRCVQGAPIEHGVHVARREWTRWRPF